MQTSQEKFWQLRLFWVAIVLPLPIWGVLYLGLSQLDISLPKPQGQLAWLLGAQVFLYPILEECVFRGLLQGRLKRYLSRCWKGISLANLIVSMIFAACHFLLRQDATSLAVFFPSLVFGALFDKTNSVKASILVHIWYNFGYFLLIHYLFV